MAEEFDRFLINLVYAVDGASKARFTGGVKEARRDVKALGQATDETERKVRGFFGRIKSGIGVVKGLAAAWAGFKIGQKAVGLLADSLERLNNLKSISDITGAAAHDIERWSYFADQTGSSASAMIAALQSIRRTSRAAAGGMERFAESYRGLGVATQVNGALRSSTDIMADIIDRFKNLDQAKREFYAQRLGIDDTLIASLVGNDVRGTLGEYDRMAAAAGLNLNEAAKSANNLCDEIGKLKTLWRILWASAAVQFFKPFLGTVKTLREAFAPLGRVLFGALGGALRYLAYLLRMTAEGLRLMLMPLGWVLRAFEALPRPLQNVARGMLAIIAAWKAFTALKMGSAIIHLLANPLTRWALVIGGLLLLLDDLAGWFQGKRSAIDWGAIGRGLDHVIAEIEKKIDAFVERLEKKFAWLLHPIDRLYEMFGGSAEEFNGENPGGSLHEQGLKETGVWMGSPSLKKGAVKKALYALNVVGTRGAQSVQSIKSTVPLGAEKTEIDARRHYEDNRRVTVEAHINVDGARSPEQTGAAVKRDIEDLTVRNLSTPVTFAPTGSE